jgi:hypothetical protein
MAVDLSSYKITPGERPAASSKQNNLLTAIQNNLNSVPPSQIQGYPGIATQYLNGLGGWTVPTTTSGGITVLPKVTQKQVLGSDGLQDLLNGEIAIPAGAMSLKGAVKFWASGTYLNNTGATKTLTFRPRLGPSELLVLSSDAIASSSVSRAWWCAGMIIARNSLFSQQGGGYFGISDASAATVGSGRPIKPDRGAYVNFMGDFDFAATAVDMTKVQSFGLWAQHSGTQTTVNITLNWARIEVT